MTTTEWVERYNRAYAQACFEQGCWEDEIPVISWGPKLPPIGWRDEYGPYYGLPPNPSPFEPKEVVDDGREGTGALNRKETPSKIMRTFTAESWINRTGTGHIALVKIENDSELPEKDELVLIDGGFCKVRRLEVQRRMDSRSPWVGIVVIKFQAFPA